MRVASSRSPIPWWIPALLGLSLLLLAAFQYRWLGEVSRAERHRLATALERGAAGFARDFDRELTRVFLAYQLFGRQPWELAELDRAYRAAAPRPELVAEVLLAVGHPGEVLALRRLDRATGELADAEWPPELAELRERLAEPSARPPDFAEHTLADDVPAVVLPFFGSFRRRRGDGDGDGEARRRGRGPGPDGGRFPPDRGPRDRFRPSTMGWVVVRLDADLLRRELFPELAGRYFGVETGRRRQVGEGTGGDLQYHLRVVKRDAPRQVIFEAGPPVASSPRSDATSDLFGFLEGEEVRHLIEDLEGALPDAPGERRPGGFNDLARGYRMGALGLRGEHRWQLRLTHPEGSLEAALAAGHRRNLLTSTAILAVLATTLALLLAATRRSERLARQQLEFVAGVTHELMTPLAAMRSAGQNLADGVVSEPSQVKRYGALVEREGRRLGDLVSQILEYAGIQSGRRAYALRETDVSEVAAEALDENRPLLAELGFEIETELGEGLPPVLADREALRGAVSNLIANAVKYAAGGAWLAVVSRRSRDGVAIQVRDRGPGIAREDLPHIFEPFYRGRELMAGNVPGSGLGLALVRHVMKAHGGRLSVKNGDAGGSVFTLLLPAPPQGGTP